jgi:hypothetical protein
MSFCSCLRSRPEVDMIARHPYRSVGVVLAVMLASAFVAGMIGQFNDGPWGALPSALGAAMWFTFLASVVVVVALSAYLAVAAFRHRRTRSAHA